MTTEIDAVAGRSPLSRWLVGDCARNRLYDDWRLVTGRRHIDAQMAVPQAEVVQLRADQDKLIGRMVTLAQVAELLLEETAELLLEETAGLVRET